MNNFYIIDYFRKIISLHFVLLMFNFNLKRSFYPINDSMLRKLMMRNYHTGNTCMLCISETTKNSRFWSQEREEEKRNPGQDTFSTSALLSVSCLSQDGESEVGVREQIP